MMKKSFILEITAGIIAVIAIAVSVSMSRSPQGTADSLIDMTHTAIPANVKDIPLKDTSGSPIRLRDLSGKHAVVAFGYTHCPDVCPLTLSDFSRIKRALDDTQRQSIAFVFISIDGARDTPDVMRRFVHRFDDTFIGVTTADDGKLRPLADAFGVYYERRKVEGSAVDYVCDHTAAIFLLDPQGDIVRTYPFGTHPDDMAADVASQL